MDVDQLKSDFRAILDDWGEPIVFKPRAGRARTIMAIVDRNPSQRIGNGVLYAPSVQIEVLNDQNDGIWSGELDGSGADKCEIAVRVGASPQVLGVYLPPSGTQGASHDAAAVSLELR